MKLPKTFRVAIYRRHDRRVEREAARDEATWRNLHQNDWVQQLLIEAERSGYERRKRQ